MTRWRLIFCCALALVAAGVVALWQSGPQEPVYQGKKLSEWIEEGTRTTSDSEGRLKAALAIQTIGTNAIPYLLSEFAVRESKLSKWSKWASRKVGLDQQFEPGNPRRRKATLTLQFLGTNAAPALPILVAYLGDEDRCTSAASVIGRCGDAALPYLLRIPLSTNYVLNHSLISALGALTQQIESAIPPLIRMTQHTNSGIRMVAVARLSKAGFRMDLVIPALIRALADTNLNVQRVATSSLGRMGERAKDAVPDLVLMMQDTNLTRVSWASNALFQIDPSALPRAAAP